GQKRIAMSEHEARHAIGQCRLADTLRAADQPGMRNAPATISIEQGRLALAMPEEIGGLARMLDRNFLFDLAGAHADGVGLVVAKTSSRNAVHTRAATVSGSALASISTQRRGSSAAICL